MKRNLTTLVLLLTFSGSLCLAQTDQPAETNDWKPSTLNQPGQQYPQVNSQGYARFRIVAPQAQSVSVSLGGRGGTPLTKTENGVWTGTTAGPLDEGFHYYHLTVDGGTFNDPGTLNFYGSSRWESGIEIPAHDRDFYALKDFPHGRFFQNGNVQGLVGYHFSQSGVFLLQSSKLLDHIRAYAAVLLPPAVVGIITDF